MKSRIFHLFVVSLGALAACGSPQPVAPTPPAPPPAPVAATPPAPPAPPPAAAPQADSGLIPRKLLFGNPDHLMPSLSPNGSQVAFIAPDNGVLNVWVAPADDIKAAKVVTHERTRPIRFFLWAYTNEHIVYANDK